MNYSEYGQSNILQILKMIQGIIMTQKSLYDTQKMWATKYMSIEITTYQRAGAKN